MGMTKLLANDYGSRLFPSRIYLLLIYISYSPPTALLQFSARTSPTVEGPTCIPNLMRTLGWMRLCTL
jgi:hypothetical protein